MPLHPNEPLALISVSDKRGLGDLAQGLVKHGYKLLATEGTAAFLAQLGLPSTPLAVFTGQPEICGGRVKTLHPKIHGGILLDPSVPGQLEEATGQGIKAIALVIANLYPFGAQAAKLADQGMAGLDELREWIDIGGPTLLRAAAKNWHHCLPVMDPDDYPQLMSALAPEGGGVLLDPALRLAWASKVFKATALYDSLIAATLEAALTGLAGAPSAAGASKGGEGPLAEEIKLSLSQVRPLRYGENPLQRAAYYRQENAPARGFSAINVLQGKEISYNNLLDLDSAARLVQALRPLPAVTIVKHTNPCGTASGDSTPAALFAKALASDPMSAFGGIVACNQEVDREAAMAIGELFFECLLAPSFTPAACSILAAKKNLRLVVAPWLAEALPSDELQWRSIAGGFLAQTALPTAFNRQTWQVVGKTPAEQGMMDECAFAMIVAAAVKSNAIVISRKRQTIGIGAGQMSRVDSVDLALAKAHRAGHSCRGAVLASDAFFPFKDSIELAAAHGITHIVQPGGSLRDGESIAAADAAGICMIHTGQRCFKH